MTGRMSMTGYPLLCPSLLSQATPVMGMGDS